MPKPIQIFAKGVDGKTSTIFIQGGVESDVDVLFEEISKQSGIQKNELRILYGTHQLEYKTGKSLEEYGIGNLSTVFIVLRLLGGHNPLQMLRVTKETLKPLEGFITVTTTEQCMITLDNDPDTKRAKMPCGHVISPMAMTQYCRSLLDEKRSAFPCPYVGSSGERCTFIWKFFLVKHVAALTQAELTEFEQKLSENYARRSLGVQQCPGCQSFCMKANKSDSVVRCPVCTKKEGHSYDFCWSCLCPAGSSHCQNPQCDGRDPRLRFLEICPRKEIVGVANCPSVRACVTCGILIEHLAACKHMTCTACKTSFCFICLKPQENGRWKCGSYNQGCTPAPVQSAIRGN